MINPSPSHTGMLVIKTPTKAESLTIKVGLVLMKKKIGKVNQMNEIPSLVFLCYLTYCSSVQV